MAEKPSSVTLTKESTANRKSVLTVAKGGSGLFLGSLVDYASRLIFGIIVARALGASGFGLYVLGVTTSFLLSSVARLGLSEGMVHLLPGALRKRDEAEVWGHLQVGLALPLVIGIGLGAILFGFADYLAQNLFHNPAVTPILRWISITIPLVATARVLLAALRGFGYVRYEVFIDSVASNVSKLGLTVIFLSLGMGLNGVLAAFALSWLIEVGLLIFFLNRHFPLKRSLRSGKRDFRGLLSFSAPVCLDQVLRQVGGNTELLLLGWLSSLAAVGIFSAAIRVQMVGAMFLQAAEMVAKPLISDLYHRGEIPVLNEIYQTLTRWSLAFILPYLLTVILFAGPLLGIFGDEFKAGALVLIIVSIGTLVNAGTGICGAIIVMTGHSRLTFLNSLIVMILHVILNVILIPIWGVIGAAVATALSLTTINLIRLLQVYKLHKLWPYDSEFIKPLMAIAAALAAILGVDHFMPAEQTLFRILFNITLLWSTYLGVMFLLGLTAEDRLILSRMKGRIGRVFLAAK